eukprot:scaffold73917_cov18-Prasinocladus_malaysianus.AAC.1
MTSRHFDKPCQGVRHLNWNQILPRDRCFVMGSLVRRPSFSLGWASISAFEHRQEQPLAFYVGRTTHLACPAPSASASCTMVCIIWVPTVQTCA